MSFGTEIVCVYGAWSSGFRSKAIAGNDLARDTGQTPTRLGGLLLLGVAAARLVEETFSRKRN